MIKEMLNLFQKISKIREKIENKIFADIMRYLNDNQLSISKDNFDRANSSLKLESGNSYCEYVTFIRYYLFKNKVWK